jgi:hypothetical protein
MRRLVFCAVAGWLILLGGRAFAYPQFQFSSGTTRCSQCHYSPSGGGLLTSWGRDESGDTISLGGDGSFLHGAWTPPAWLALGADVRLAGLYNNSGGPESPEAAFFPMQADVYARVAFTDQLSLYVQGGIRGDTRPADSSIGGRFGTLGDRFDSTEHYLMWKSGGTGAYVRAGRFYAPFGLRFAEHIFFVQRYTGYNIYDETYTLSGGWVDEDWEAHVSAFAPPPSSFPSALQPVDTHESGAAVYAEKRFESMAMLALQARLGFGKEVNRYEGGAVGKLWIEKGKALFMGEADLIRQSVSAAGAGETGAVTYLGVNVFPSRGWMVGVAHELYQEDLSVKGTARNAFDLEVNFFPWAHCEVLAFGRYQVTGSAGGTDPNAPPSLQYGSPNASLFMLQLHYYM